MIGWLNDFNDIRKKNKMAKTLLFLFFFLCLTGVYSQATILSSGNSSASNSGSFSYSVGQVFVNSNTSSVGQVSQGVQQTYHVSVLTSNESILDEKSVYAFYPNPTVDYITLKCTSPNTENKQAKLYDANGRLLEVYVLTNEKEDISLLHLEPANYFLQITDGQEAQTTLKITKH